MLVVEGAGIMLITKLVLKVGMNEALFLQQLHYFLEQRGVQKEGRKWFFHTYEQWLQQFPYLSKSSLRRAIHSLEKQGVIDRCPNFNTRKSDHTMWYTINYNCLHRLFEETDVRDVQNEQAACSNWTQPAVQNEQAMCSNWTSPSSQFEHNEVLKMNTSILKELNKRKIEDIVIYLNTCTGNYFSVTDEQVTSPIFTKLQQGYSTEQLKDMIIQKNGTCNMHPQYLFASEGDGTWRKMSS